MSDMLRYRIIERVGTDADHVWMEVDTGAFTRMPRSYGADPTMRDAEEYARKFNTATRQIQIWDAAERGF